MRGKRTYTGWLTTADPREAFSLTTATGRVVATASFTGTNKLHLHLERPDHTQPTSRYGRSELRLVKDVPSGRYRLVVSGPPTRFTLVVTYRL